MKLKTRSYLDGFGEIRSFLELDAGIRREILESLDPEREDAFPHPWKRGYSAAIRKALGH